MAGQNQSGAVTTIARLNIRKGKPSIAAPIATRAEPGVALAVHATITGDMVEGNADWYAGDNATFFWSGACGDFRPTGQGGLAVHRRPNGTIQTLSEAEIRRIFGTFDWSEASPKGAVNIDPAWERANIVDLATPLLAKFGAPRIRCHAKAHDPLARVFAALVAAGLEDHILAYEGCLVPRHKGWDPARGLSAHSWGIAIDLNARWNGYGAAPAPLGTHGSTRELIACFEAEGFAWGGYFQPDSIRDGMHFELARTDL